MSAVYLAQDSTFDRQVAVKVLAAGLGENADNRERFRREARAIAMLEHAAVVPVYDYGEDGGQLFLVMRYMQGGSLRDRLTRGRLPLPAAAAVARRIASALDKAHSMGMIHRDIKPGNVLFDLEDNPYITDFGLVKMAAASVQLTHSEFFGTPAYTSPEQCQGEKTVDARADVYSLCAMFFHMVTGSPPYQAGNAVALLMKHVTDPIPRLADAAPDLPPSLQAVIDRGMAKSPADRFPSAGEMARAVDRIVSSAPQTSAPAASGVWGKATVEGISSSPATESARAVSFELLRPAARPESKVDVATRKEPSVRAEGSAASDGSAVDPEATNHVVPAPAPAKRRRLDWTPQVDAPPPHSAAAPQSTAGSSESAYIQTSKPQPRKTAGIPILVVIVVLLAVSVIYFAVQKGLF
jgi:serine/threonine-protein kinase